MMHACCLVVYSFTLDSCLCMLYVLQSGFWDMEYVYSKSLEGPIVDGVGLGYPRFFALPGQALDSDGAWSRFVRNGRISLRCEVLECE